MSIIQINTEDPRDVKALQLAGTAAEWVPLPGGAYGIRSYRVTAESCDCPDNARGNVCKHRRSVKIHQALSASTAPQPVTAPAPVTARADVDEIAFRNARYTCRCSGSGSQVCAETCETAEGMRAHYAAVHHWTIDLAMVRAAEFEYRKLTASARDHDGRGTCRACSRVFVLQNGFVPSHGTDAGTPCSGGRDVSLEFSAENKLPTDELFRRLGGD